MSHSNNSLLYLVQLLRNINTLGYILQRYEFNTSNLLLLERDVSQPARISGRRGVELEGRRQLLVHPTVPLSDGLVGALRPRAGPPGGAWGSPWDTPDSALAVGRRTAAGAHGGDVFGGVVCGCLKLSITHISFYVAYLHF